MRYVLILLLLASPAFAYERANPKDKVPNPKMLAKVKAKYSTKRMTERERKRAEYAAAKEAKRLAYLRSKGIDTKPKLKPNEVGVYYNTTLHYNIVRVIDKTTLEITRSVYVPGVSKGIGSNSVTVKRSRSYNEGKFILEGIDTTAPWLKVESFITPSMYEVNRTKKGHPIYKYVGCLRERDWNRRIK